MLVAVVLSGWLNATGSADAGHCAVLEDDAKRLACYDAVYRTTRASLSQPAEASDFGLSEQQRQERSAKAGIEDSDSIVSRIKLVEPTKDGRALIDLENGQRWYQVVATDRLYFKVGQTIRIRKASLGSFLATVEGESGAGAIRVRRLH